MWEVQTWTILLHTCPGAADTFGTSLGHCWDHVGSLVGHVWVMFGTRLGPYICTACLLMFCFKSCSFLPLFCFFCNLRYFLFLFFHFQVNFIDVIYHMGFFVKRNTTVIANKFLIIWLFFWFLREFGVPNSWKGSRCGSSCDGRSPPKFSLASGFNKFAAGARGIANLGGGLYLGNLFNQYNLYGVKLPSFLGGFQYCVIHNKWKHRCI